LPVECIALDSYRDSTRYGFEQLRAARSRLGRLVGLRPDTSGRIRVDRLRRGKFFRV
jgi:hypothetical protein